MKPTIGILAVLCCLSATAFAQGRQALPAGHPWGMRHANEARTSQSDWPGADLGEIDWQVSPTGQTLWEVTFEDGGRLGSSYGSVIVDAAGNLFLGMGTGKRWAIDLEKQVLVYNRNGGKFGSFPLPEVAGTSSVALGDDGTLYVGCLDGKLYALKE